MKSPAGVGRRLPSRLARRDAGSGSGGTGEGDRDGGPSILHWRAPRGRGRRLADDEDVDAGSDDAGGSVEEFQVFSTEVLPSAAAAPRARSSSRSGSVKSVMASDGDELAFAVNWDNLSSQPVPDHGEPNRRKSRVTTPEVSPTKDRPTRRPASAQRTPSTSRRTVSPFPGNWPALDNDSTDAVSPPTPAEARLWSADIPGESSPVRRRGSVSPTALGTHRRGASPARSAARQRSRTQSPGVSARQPRKGSFSSRQEGSPTQGPRIQPLSPPPRESHARSAPQRRLVKVSASDLGLTPREALNPEVVRGALRRFKSDSGESLLRPVRSGHRPRPQPQPHPPPVRLNPDSVTPGRNHRRRGVRAASSAFPGHDGSVSVGSEERSTDSRSAMGRHASPHSNGRRSTSFTERGSSKTLPALFVMDDDDARIATRRPRRSASVTRRPRSLSRGSETRASRSQSSVAHSAAPSEERRRGGRARPSEARSLDRAIHHLPLPSDSQSESGHAAYSGEDLSVPSFGQEDRASHKRTEGRSHSHNRTASRVGLGHESPGRARSGSMRLTSEDKKRGSRTSNDHRQGYASLDREFATSGRDRPARGVRRAESGELLQMMDQLGISSDQLKGLQELGLTISKV